MKQSGFRWAGRKVAAKRRFVSLGLAFAVGSNYLVASTAMAGVEFAGNYWHTGLGSPNTVQSVSATDPLMLDEGRTFADTTLYVTGSLSSGTLKAKAVSATPATEFASTSAYASVRLRDDFSFTSGFGQTAYLDWSFEGSILQGTTPSFVNGTSEGSLTVVVYPGHGGIVPGYFTQRLVRTGECVSDIQMRCYFGASIALAGSMAIPIAPGFFSLDVTLSAGAQQGDTADFSNTASLYLRLPDGIEVTSASNMLFQTAAPIPAVPEPHSYLLLFVGVATIATVMKNRSASMELIV